MLILAVSIARERPSSHRVPLASFPLRSVIPCASMDRWLVIPIVPDQRRLACFHRALQDLKAVQWAAPMASEGRRAVMPYCSAGAVLWWTSTSLCNGLGAAGV